MPQKASLFRLESETQKALSELGKLLGRPMNKLVNEAVKSYLQQTSEKERELEKTLENLRAYRRASSQGQAEIEGEATEGAAGKIDSTTLHAAREFVRRISMEYQVSAAILFGSRARGTHRSDSDADIAVLLRGAHGNFTQTMLGMVDVAFDVLLETNVHIQPLPIWEDQWENSDKHSNPRLLENIRREGVPL